MDLHQFPLASPRPGIVHHLSLPNWCAAHAPPPLPGGQEGRVVHLTGEASVPHLAAGSAAFTSTAPRAAFLGAPDSHTLDLVHVREGWDGWLHRC